MAKRIEELDKNLKLDGSRVERGVRWIPVSDLRSTVRGLAWHRRNRGRFCRLPRHAENVVRPGVWELAQNMAGARLCFTSNTTRMHVRVRLPGTVPYPHMPASGHSGLALYSGPPQRLKPWAFAIPGVDEVEFERELFRGVSRQSREFTLYLPMYNGIESLELGLSSTATLTSASPSVLKKPVVFYGTSITQGGCGSTAGSDYPSILSRRLNIDIVNLGFSGNGCGESELADLLCEINASAYVLDYVANAGVVGLEKTLPRFIDILRKAHPRVPVILVSQVVFATCSVHASARRNQEAQRDLMLGEYAKRRRADDENIHFIDGDSLIPPGADLAYCDGVHPTSAGFQMMADAMAPQIEKILL